MVVREGPGLPLRTEAEHLPSSHPFDWKYSWGKGARLKYLSWHQRRRAVLRSLGADTARLCIAKSSEASWWEWDEGSALYFWRWNGRWRRWARDGQPHFLVGDLPNFHTPQRSPSSAEEGQVVSKKVNKVRRRLYIEPGLVRSLTHMFPVPKGLDDWRMVYNGTSSGLNRVIWAPHFGLPTMRHTLRSLMADYFQCDLDHS